MKTFTSISKIDIAIVAIPEVHADVSFMDSRTFSISNGTIEIAKIVQNAGPFLAIATIESKLH